MPLAHNLTRETAQHRSRTVTLSDQSIHLDLTGAPTEAATFTSTSTLRLTCTEGAVSIDLVADAAPCVLLDGVELDANATSFEDSLVTVRGLTPGREHVVTVIAECHYSHTGEGLHRFRDPQDGETYLFTHFEPTDARRVFACFDQPDLKTHFAISVTAPSHWLVRSNGAPESAEPAAASDETHGNTTTDLTLTTFTPTMPQSTYIVCVIAGPYALVEDEAVLSDGRRVPLSIMCRPAMRASLPSADMLRWTKAGLPWCERKFGCSYPWGTYDQIFVPEYNIGAMENPGLVTFNENYLKRGDATRSEREALATTLLHEMAHMWFGDLVTMPWWDDLWLKESFADFIGAQAASEVTEFDDAWATFGLGRKAWAYSADQLPTTHPIVADIPDVEAARANFDGITYAKGASVLRQLVAYAGEDAFYEGAALYFERHAFTNATLDDFLDALGEASGRDMTAWAQAWLQTSGPDTLEVAGGVITRRGDRTRPHRFHATAFDVEAPDASEAAAWHATGDAWLDLEGESDTLELPGELRGAVVLVDDEDWTYAKIAPSTETLELFATQLCHLASATHRATAWGQLWQATRDARLPAETFVRAGLTQLADEPSATIVDGAGRFAIAAITSYLPDAASRADWAQAFWRVAIDRADASTGTDLPGVWRRLALLVAALAPSVDDELRALLDAHTPFEPDQDERWSVLTSLAAHTRDDDARRDVDARLADERTRDTTQRGAAQALGATAALGLDDTKQAAWQRVDDASLTNEQVAALVAGLTHPASVELAGAYADSYLDHLETWWRERSQVIASRLVRVLFDTQPNTEAAEAWLASHPDAPGALRRIVVEEVDQLQRHRRAQAVSDGSRP